VLKFILSVQYCFTELVQRMFKCDVYHTRDTVKQYLPRVRKQLSCCTKMKQIEQFSAWKSSTVSHLIWGESYSNTMGPEMSTMGPETSTMGHE